MSDENKNLEAEKTQPLRKTSAVPLRKETVRVTLKATPGGAKPPAPAPPAAPAPPSAPKPPAAPPAPSAPTPAAAAPAPAPKKDKTEPVLPDVTSAVPLKQETMRVTLKAEDAAPSPAPTIPLGAATPKPAAAAPTVQLKAGGAAPTGPATVPLQTGGASQPLPKATVQLQQTQPLTQPLGGGTPAPSITTAGEEEIEEKSASGSMDILAIAAFVVALIVLGCQLAHSSVWIDAHEGGSWGALFSS